MVNTVFKCPSSAKFRARQIIIITNYIVVSSVVIKGLTSIFTILDTILFFLDAGVIKMR